MPIEAIDIESFLDMDNMDVFTFGRPPVAIDIMTKFADFSFSEVYDTAVIKDINGLLVRVIHLNKLREAKHFAGRYKGLDDLENLENL